MALSLFGVTATTVKEDHFPMFDAFSATSNPTSTVVGRFIDEKAGELAGKLLLKNISAAAVHALGAGEPAYVWCRETLTIMVAVRVLAVATQQYPELAKELRSELVARFKVLDEGGAVAIGNASLDDSTDAPPDGPTTHINVHALDTADPDDMSTAEPVLRAKDSL